MTHQFREKRRQTHNNTTHRQQQQHSSRHIIIITQSLAVDSYNILPQNSQTTTTTLYFSITIRTMKFSLLSLALFLPLTNAFAPASRTHTTTTQYSKSALNIAAPEALQGAWTAYNDALEANPLVVKSVTASVILGAADLAGQAVEDVKSGRQVGEDIDLARAARFAFFGLVLQAPWNHFYYQILDGAIPPTDDPWTPTTAVKTVIDQFVQAPIFTVLIFAFLGFLEGKNFEAIQEQLDEDYKDTMIANWKLWVPASFINLALIPPIFRVLYLNIVFFFWSIFLSLKLNKEEA